MSFDLVVRGGTVVDGTGAPGRRADVAISSDRVAVIGQISATARRELRADGCVVAPGFINILSHAYTTLQVEPTGMSELYQGVTTEVFGEGFSAGPVTGRMAPLLADDSPGPATRRTWPRLRDFLDHLARQGVGPNVASFVGADNLRMIQAGADDRPLTETELNAACHLLDRELTDGALGVGSALIYAPGSYASTAELTAYAAVIARHDALYISHIRDEADHLLGAIDELITIAEATGARSEIHHLKASGRPNWPSMPAALERVQRARDAGLSVSANLYPYEAGSTTLNACIPPCFHAGGSQALRERLADQTARRLIKAAIATSGEGWENLYLGSGGADGVLVLGPPGTDHHGRTLGEVSARRGDRDPVATLLDLVAADPGVMAAYFGIDEANIRLALQRSWVSIGSDAETMSADAAQAGALVHPRTYGAFARVLGPYVRQGVLPLADAVRRMTGLPARNLKLLDRGVLREGSFADLAVFDPAAVQDRATYRNPHRYATGMRHVLINGVVALLDGTPTGALAGRALRRAACDH